MSIPTTSVNWTDSGELFSENFEDIYFSSAGGLAEKDYVFFKHNNLTERFTRGERLIIAETGFGTGLNFLITLKNWQAINPTVPWHYISTEKYPLSKSQLESIYQLFINKWPELHACCKEVLDHYPAITHYPAVAGRHEVDLFSGKVHLSLLLGDACEQLTALENDNSTKVSAWYLDGFAPSKNPSMWQQPLFDTIARLSGPSATLSTYTVAGAVRRGLIQAGFTIHKTTGFGIKREMIYGRYN